MASLKENFYEAIKLDSIIENGITDTVKKEPDFVTENQKKLSAALTAYTRDILRRKNHNDKNTFHLPRQYLLKTLEILERQGLLNILVQILHQFYIKFERAL